MATRILGPTRSRRRRRFLLAPIFLVVLVALFVTAGAQAVHDLELFELDRNALDDGTVAGDDWDSLPGSSQDSTGILPDITPLPGGTQFQAGGSKDDLDITSWLWKAGEPLDKDDITNAYAASYINTVDTGENDVGDLIVYFGLDRFSTAGSAQVGFWFLQDPDFGLSNRAAGGGFEFNGQHQDNDVLVQSNFTNGGVISNLTVYKWLAGALVEVGTVTASDCVTSAPDDDPACATVNQSPEDAPWDYTPKANEGPPGTFQPSAFFEGGINITRLVPDATCFANFLAETRSSTPFDARLKDFVQGQFGECEANITTTPSDASIQLGESITDTAVVEGSGLNPPTPTGFVKFFICSPSELTNGTCASGGTFVDVDGDEPDGEELTPDPDDPTKANAESDPFTPDVVGTWCWRGEYSGDDFYNPVTDSSTGECFTVTDITETSTAQNWTPNDSATITSTGDSNLDGTVRFQLYSDGACGASGGTVLYQEDVDVPSGTASPHTVVTSNGDGDPATGLASDEVFDVSDSPVNVSWRVTFTSDDTNVAGSTANCETSTGLTIDDDNEPPPPPSP
jgi:hypothetical protein